MEASYSFYDGPYRFDAPDLLIGYDGGYRNGWDCATGAVTSEVFSDNTKSWSGDHCMDPESVPGILFSNLKVEAEKPSLVDIGPTVLNLFVEYWDAIVIDSFTISLFTAVVLKILLDPGLIIELFQ